MKKRVFSVVGFLFGFFVFILSACSNPSNGNSEWTEISSLNQITGIWESSFTVDVPEIPLSTLLENSGIDLETLLAGSGISQYPGIKIEDLIPDTLAAAPLDCTETFTVSNSQIESDLSINCKRYLETTMGKPVTPFIWLSLYSSQEQFIPDFIDSIDNVPFNITSAELTNNYEIIISGIIPVQADAAIPFTEGFSLSINQDKTALKAIVDLPVLSTQEIILTRKQ